MRRRWAIGAAVVYLLGCLALGWATTLFFNHYVNYAWRGHGDPHVARRWGLEVADATVTAQGPVRVRDAWVERGHGRTFTIPLLPYPDVFFMNRYSLKLDKQAPFRVLHVTLDADDRDGLELVDVPETAKLPCGGDARVPGRYHCAIWVPDPARRVFRGKTAAGEFEMTLLSGNQGGKS